MATYSSDRALLFNWSLLPRARSKKTLLLETVPRGTSDTEEDTKSKTRSTVEQSIQMASKEPLYSYDDKTKTAPTSNKGAKKKTKIDIPPRKPDGSPWKRGDEIPGVGTVLFLAHGTPVCRAPGGGGVVGGGRLAKAEWARDATVADVARLVAAVRRAKPSRNGRGRGWSEVARRLARAGVKVPTVQHSAVVSYHEVLAWCARNGVRAIRGKDLRRLCVQYLELRPKERNLEKSCR